MADMMFSDSSFTRGDISPGDTGSGEGSGSDFTDFLTDTYTPEVESTIEGSGTEEMTDESEDFTTVSGVTEVTEVTESGATEQSTAESMTEESTVSGGKLTEFEIGETFIKNNTCLIVFICKETI